MPVMSSEGIFITGLGILSPLGRGPVSTLRSLQNAACGIRRTNLFGPDADQTMPVGTVDAPVETESTVPRTHALALTAARDAMAGKEGAPDAVVVGVTTGGMPKTELLIDSKVQSPGEYSYHGAGTVAVYLADHLGCTGPVFTVATACSSGTAAVKIAAELIRHGKAKRVLAGGVDALCRFTYYGFFSLQLMDPAGARPLDKDRAGISLGEGAAMLLLEGAPAAPQGSLAQILGGGISCDAYHPTAPHPQGEGALKAMREAIADAGIAPADIEYINLHGTATRDNDASEAMAIRTLFGDHIPPVSSTKGMTGHLLGAAGAVECAICSLSVSKGIVPGNAGCTNPDPALGLPAVMKPEQHPVRIALSNSFGFGGNNAAVVIGSADLRPAGRKTVPSLSLQVTGTACLTGIGGTDASFQRFSQGTSLAGTLSDDEVSRDLPQRQIRRLKRLPRMALALAAAARKDAGGSARPSSIFFGTGWGPLSETYDFIMKLFESGMKFPSPTDFINSVHNAPAGQIAMELKAMGPNLTATGGDYSFEQALVLAAMLSPENGDVLLLGADEMHRELSPLFDTSVRGSTLSDGGGAILAVATGTPSGPCLTPLAYRKAPEDAGRMTADYLNIAQDIPEQYGAVFAGIPSAYETTAREQMNSFLSGSGFRGPVIDYRKYTGQYATASAAAAVLALQLIKQGSIPSLLTGSGEVVLGEKGILIMGLGPFCTAMDIRMKGTHASA